MTPRRRILLRRSLVLLFLLPFVLHAQQPPRQDQDQTTPAPPPAQPEAQTAIVQYYGELMTQLPSDTILYLIDSVVFYHNGTYIQCDSAKRYDEYRMECFGNVVINKDSTYIYGDRASYDGHTSIAKIYSPLLKVVNGDATMWVFNYMEFNTQTNIGEYNEGAVITQRDNLMESDRGIFSGDSSTITFVGHVAMRNDDYKIRTDSVRYDFDNEIVTFLTRAYIWNKERDFLTAERGDYVRATSTYHFTRNAYAMTPDQEFWADTMNYESAIRKVTMRSNLQILDTTQRSIGLGDYGYYNDSLKNGLLTDNPALILYDTLVVRQDTLPAPDSLITAGTSLQTVSADSAQLTPATADSTRQVEADSLTARQPRIIPSVVRRDTIQPDSSFARADTILFDSYPPGKSKPKPQPAVQQQAPTIAAQTDSVAQPDSINLQTLPVPTGDTTLLATVTSADSLSQSTHPEGSNPAAQLPNADTLTGDRQTANVPQPVAITGTPIEPDQPVDDSSTVRPMIGVEEPPHPTGPDSTLLAARPTTPAHGKKDTLERVIRARHNVRMWRSDMQSVCDSMIAYSVDSTSSLFGRPLIWNGPNQLTADRIDLYSRNEELDYAEFIGSPFVTQQVENADTLFNQASGRLLQAWFRNNEISRAIMTGNVSNYYYRGEDSLPPTDFMVLTCASLTIDFEDQEPVRLNWGGQGNWYIDPINKIPAGQSQRLPGFSWEPERKPRNRYDITLRSIRPSHRHVVEGYALPVFPIEERFNATREALLQGGSWRDRSELLDNRILHLNDYQYLF